MKNMLNSIEERKIKFESFNWIHQQYFVVQLKGIKLRWKCQKLKVLNNIFGFEIKHFLEEKYTKCATKLYTRAVWVNDFKVYFPFERNEHYYTKIIAANESLDLSVKKITRVFFPSFSQNKLNFPSTIFAMNFRIW